MQKVESITGGLQSPSFLRQDGAVLITGGLGGIGKQVAHWLINTHHVQDIVLTSRKGMATPGAEMVTDEIMQLGARVDIVARDVSDLSKVKDLMARFDSERPLRGVIHAAGIVDNGVLLTMTLERFAEVFAPKVNGAWNLHQLTKDMDLDVFMMFSSIAGALGMVCLGNYAAANTFLDSLAHMRRMQGLPGTAVAYGVWNGDGMARDLTGRTTLAHLARFGLDPLASEDGLSILEMAVHSGRALTVGAALNLQKLHTYLNGEVTGAPDRTLFYSKLLARSQEDGPSCSMKSPNERRSRNLKEALAEATKEQHATIVLAMVRETVGKALGFQTADEISVDAPLQDLGFDSLTAVLLRNELAQLTQLRTLSATWNYPNIRALSEFLLCQLQNQSSTNSHTGQLKTIEKSTPDISGARNGYLDPTLTFDNIDQVSRPTTVFITGATGFVGAPMPHEIPTQGIDAYCLVRADGVDQGKERLIKALMDYQLWQPDYEPLLVPVIGDLSQPLFNLSRSEFDRLADRVDAIAHCGALVDWMRPLSQYIGPNVVSAHEVLRLASQGRGKAVHVVSTLATLPMHLGYEVPTTYREHGYSTSKYMAERMVAAARWRGAKASVYRVPFVTASATSGHYRLDRGDFLHNMIAGSIEMGFFPSLDADLSVVQPVDYLCKTIVAVMVNDRNRIGNDFDFVNKHAVSVDHFFELMGAATDDGSVYHTLPFMQWREKALDYAAAHPRSSLARISAVVDGLSDATAAAGMLKGLPTGRHVFGGDLYPAPLVDEKLVRKYRVRIDQDRHRFQQC